MEQVLSLLSPIGYILGGCVIGLGIAAKRLRAEGESTIAATFRVFSGGGPGPRQR